MENSEGQSWDSSSASRTYAVTGVEGPGWGLARGQAAPWACEEHAGRALSPPGHLDEDGPAGVS